MSERFKMPPIRDFGFYQRRKHDKWREVPAPTPALEASMADSHAHIHMLPDPAWELARCAANGVDHVCMIVDPSEDGTRPFDELGEWQAQAARLLDDAQRRELRAAQSPREQARQERQAPLTFEGQVEQEGRSCQLPGEQRLKTAPVAPQVRIAAGVHPHNAQLYSEAVEGELLARLSDRRVTTVGEIGLDYHYDLSPRDVQRRVFERQIAIAKQCDLPVTLHLRSGDDPVADNAHREAFEILERVGFPGRGTLLHCCALPPDELRPWIEAGCYVAYGGALTFKNADAAREGARLVPENRLMVETDSPYMTPEPMRGTVCTPAHVIFTAACLAETRDIAPGEARRRFLQLLHDNTLRFQGETVA